MADSNKDRKPEAKDDDVRSMSGSRGDDYSDDRKREKRKKSKRRKERRRSYDSDSADGYSDEDSSEGHRRRRRKSKKKRKSSSRRKYDSDDSDGHSDDSSDHSKERRRRKKKKKRRRRDDNSSASSSSESDRKRKRHRKEKKKSSSSNRKSEPGDDGKPTFGKYGVLRAADFHKEQTQRSFTIWMEEVKGIGAFSGPKWELQEYYKEYMEDYNTATLPHMKYYNYDKWEMEEYQRNKEKLSSGSGSGLKSDEALHRQTLHQQAAAKRKQEEAFALSLMSKEKMEEMKWKKQLQSEMAHAYKTGDQETYLRLKNRLEPSER